VNILGLLRSPVKFEFPLRNRAGLACVTVGPWHVYFFVWREHWAWGYEDDWYDGPLPNYGLGPFILACAMWPDSWCYFCNDHDCSDHMRHG